MGGGFPTHLQEFFFWGPFPGTLFTIKERWLLGLHWHFSLFMSSRLKFSAESKMCYLLIGILGKTPRPWIFIRFWRSRNCSSRLLPKMGKLRICFWIFFHNVDTVGSIEIWWNFTVYGNEIMIQGYCLFRARRKKRHDESLLCFWFATLKLCGETMGTNICLCKNVQLAGTNSSNVTLFHRMLILGNI